MREILESGEDVLVISHPQIMRALAIVWIGLPHHLGSAFDLSRGAVSELGFIHANPAIIHWNAPTEDWGETRAKPIHQWFA